MSEVNKIANYNQMMSWLTRPSVPKTETREDFAIGGGVIEGEDLGTREGFAGPKLIKIGKDKGNYIVRYRDKKFGRREGQTGFNEGNTDPMTKKEADAFYEDLLSKKEAKKASGLKSKNIKVKNQAQQINTFVSDFIDQNLGKYGIKDYDKFKKELNETFEQSGIEDAGSRKSKYKGFPNIATAESEVPFSKFDMETINRSAKTDTTGNYFKKLFYTGKLKTDDNFRNRVERYLDYNNTDKKFYGDGNPIDRKALINQYADVLNDSAEPNEDIRFLLENKDVGEGKFRSGIIRQFFPEKADIYIKKKATSSSSYTKDVATIENLLSNKQVKDTLNGHPSINSFMRGQSEQLKKIFDASELPDNLNFNTDHVEGIAEIAKLDNPDDIMRGLRNLIGMTQERNRNLGWKGYSKKRRELTDKINGGFDPQKNLDELNKITSESYPEVKNKKAYSLKNGVLSVTDNFKFFSNPETMFKQYFTELTSTKEGLNALKIQYKTNEDLKKLLLEDPNLRKNVIVDDLTETIPGVTTADKLGKPPATVEKEMFKKATNRFKNQRGFIDPTLLGADKIAEGIDKLKMYGPDYAKQILNTTRNIGKAAVLPELVFGAGLAPLDLGEGRTAKETLLNAVTLGAGIPINDALDRSAYVKKFGLDDVLFQAQMKQSSQGENYRGYTVPDLTEREKLALEKAKEFDEKVLKSRLEKKLKERKDLTQEMQNLPDADMRSGAMNGGIMRLGFADGPKDPKMNRRTFMKVMGGIASIPIVGRLMKPATKAIEAAAPAIQRSVEGVPEFLMDLIAKVKLKAKTKGYEYFTGNKPEEFKDVYQVDNYVVTEKGNKTIIREIDQDGDMLYKENQMELDYDPETGGYTYNEASARPDAEGKLKDVEEYIEEDDLENMRKYTYDE